MGNNKNTEQLKQLICESIRENNCECYCNHPYCNKVDILAENLFASNALFPPVKIGQTVYRIAKSYSTCRIGSTWDDISCAGCELECDSHATYAISEEIVESIAFDGTRWSVRTNRSCCNYRGIDISPDFDVFRDKSRLEAYIAEKENQRKE